jgi:hypothetical protein
MIDSYTWRGGKEMLLRMGVGLPVAVLVLPALFEEANRMRRFTVSVMWQLEMRKIGTLLPDLPGQGESSTPLGAARMADWQEAVAAIPDKPLHVIAFRGGSLLGSDFRHRWHFAPDSGERLLRDMVRATALSEGVPASEIVARARQEQTRLAGNLIGPDLYNDLCAAKPVDGAIVSKVEGPNLWRSAEPGDDSAYAGLVADEIAVWVQTCAVT